MIHIDTFDRANCDVFATLCTSILEYVSHGILCTMTQIIVVWISVPQVETHLFQCYWQVDLWEIMPYNILKLYTVCSQWWQIHQPDGLSISMIRKRLPRDFTVMLHHGYPHVYYRHRDWRSLSNYPQINTCLLAQYLSVSVSCCVNTGQTIGNYQCHIWIIPSMRLRASIH